MLINVKRVINFFKYVNENVWILFRFSVLEYLVANKPDNSCNDILVDIYYSCYGIKPTENQKIYVLMVICLIVLNNLKIMDIIP